MPLCACQRAPLTRPSKAHGQRPKFRPTQTWERHAPAEMLAQHIHGNPDGAEQAFNFAAWPCAAARSVQAKEWLVPWREGRQLRNL